MPLLILIAEDDPGIRLSVSDYLEISGYSAIAAEDGEKALSLLETYRPHLLISDIKMPGKDGYELVKQVRQRPEFRLLPVIFLTERNSTEERIRGYQVGCDLYLPKPFEMEELGAVIRNLLERSQIVQSELRYSQLEHPSVVAPSEPTEAIAQLSINDYDLTKREQEVLNLLTIGHSNQEIGNNLHLSHRTIEKYVSSLLRKTDTNNRAELIRFAFKHHLVNDE
ncbi:MAG: response regulator transcription factor [Xenococcaceae cyanobacterium]